MRALTKNPVATVLGLIALALGAALVVVLLTDDSDDSPARASTPPTRTVRTPPAALKGSARTGSPATVGKPAALRRASRLAPKTAGATGQPAFYNATIEGQIGQWN